MSDQDLEDVLYANFSGIGRVSGSDLTFDPGGEMSSVEDDEAGSAAFGTKKRGAVLDLDALKTSKITIKQLRDFKGSITVTTVSSSWAMLNARCTSPTPLSKGRVKLQFSSINRAQEVGS